MGTMMEKEDKINEEQAGFRPYRSCVDHVYTLDKKPKAGKTRINNVTFVSRCTEGLRHNQRKYVENGEKYDGMCEKC